MNDIYLYLIISLVFLIIIILIVEYSLYARWHTSYYRTGLTIFRKSITIPESSKYFHKKMIIDSSDLSRGILKDRHHYLQFNNISKTEVLFRVEFWAIFNLIPITRGNLVFDSKNKNIIITGRLNYLPIILLLIAITQAFFTGIEFLLLPLLLGIFLGALFLFQVEEFFILNKYLNKKYG